MTSKPRSAVLAAICVYDLRVKLQATGRSYQTGEQPRLFFYFTGEVLLFNERPGGSCQVTMASNLDGNPKLFGAVAHPTGNDRKLDIGLALPLDQLRDLGHVLQLFGDKPIDPTVLTCTLADSSTTTPTSNGDITETIITAISTGWRDD